MRVLASYQTTYICACKSKVCESSYALLLQVECLEEACVQYLCNQAGHMSSQMLVCLARLGDHLGLSALVTAAAEHIVQLPWQLNTLALAAVLQTSFYKHRQDKCSELLHHAQRGAYSELQVLQLLESMSCEEAEIAAIMQVDILQPGELQILLAILVNAEHSAPSKLLHKAVQQHVKCGNMYDQILTEEDDDAMDAKQANSPTRCIPNMIFVSEHDGFRFDYGSQHYINDPRRIPDSQLQVWVKSNNINGKMPYVCMCLCLYQCACDKATLLDSRSDPPCLCPVLCIPGGIANFN